MPTITVRRFDYEALKTMLKPDDRIVILSCDSCAKLSDGLGGEQGLRSLADKLIADGFEVLHRELLPVACSPKQLRDRLQNELMRQLLSEADVLIPLACRAGENITSELLPGLRLLRVTRTLGAGSFSPETGARLTEPLADVELEIDDPEGISLSDAAERLGLHAGEF